MDNTIQYLIALDLDGTSVRYDPRLEMDPALIEYINSLRPQGVSWVMNSDRYTDTMTDIAGLLESEKKPAAILSCQRFIHLLNSDNSYMSFSPWNTKQMQVHEKLWSNIAPFFNDWRKAVEKNYTIIDSVINELVFAFMVPADQTQELRELMQKFIEPWPEAQVSGNQEWTFILHSSFSKGRVLRKCAELLSVSSRNIIAVGDGINDITMLDGSVTPLVGCPANACPKVIKAVTEAGGVVAESEAAAGALQVLEHYLNHLLQNTCSGRF